MKKLLVAVSCLAPALASADVGIGGSVRSNDLAVYVPIAVSEGLRVEPFFGWTAQEQNGAGATQYETFFAGVGVFGLAPVADHIRLLAGARLAYDRAEISSACCREDADGYTIEPTIGAEYLITERLSIALEEYLYYSKRDTDSSGPFSSGIYEAEYKGTGNRLIARFMF